MLHVAKKVWKICHKTFNGIITKKTSWFAFSVPLHGQLIRVALVAKLVQA